MLTFHLQWGKPLLVSKAFAPWSILLSGSGDLLSSLCHQHESQQGEGGPSKALSSSPEWDLESYLPHILSTERPPLRSPSASNIFFLVCITFWNDLAPLFIFMVMQLPQTWGPFCLVPCPHPHPLCLGQYVVQSSARRMCANENEAGGWGREVDDTLACRESHTPSAGAGLPGLGHHPPNPVSRIVSQAYSAPRPSHPPQLTCSSWAKLTD